MCTNVFGFNESYCIVEHDLDSLVHQMIEYMTCIQQECYLLNVKKFESVFIRIEKDISDFKGEQIVIPMGEKDFDILDGADRKIECQRS